MKSEWMLKSSSTRRHTSFPNTFDKIIKIFLLFYRTEHRVPLCLCLGYPT